MPSTMRPRNLPLPTAYHSGFGVGQVVRNGLNYATVDAQANAGADTIYTSPMMIPAGTRFDRVGAKGRGTQSGTFEMGLYASDDNGYPSDLIAQFPQQTANNDSWVEQTIDLTVHETALYWLAIQPTSATFQSKQVKGGGLFKVAGTAAGEGFAWGYFKTGQTAATLPSTFPSSPGILDSGFVIDMRVLEAPSPTTALLHNNRPQVYWGQVGEYVTFADRINDVGGAAFSVVSDTLYVIPIVLQEATHIVQVISAFPVNNEAGNGWNVIYDGNLDGYPRDLIFLGASKALTDGSTIDNVDFVLQPGIYWIGIQTDGTGAGDNTAGRLSDGYLQFSTSGPSSSTFYSHAGLSVSGSGTQDPFPSGAAGVDTAINAALIMEKEGQYLPSSARPNVFTPWHIYHEGWYVGPVGIPHTVENIKLSSKGKYYAIQFTLDRNITIDQVYYDINALSGTFTFDLAIYDDIGYLPGSILYSTQETGVSVPGRRAVSVDWPMQPGRYWFVVGNDGGAAPETVDLYEHQSIAYRNAVSGDFASAAVDDISATSLPNPWSGVGGWNEKWPSAGFRIGSYS